LMDINSLNAPISLDRSFGRYLKGFINRPTDFGNADRSFGSMVANPMLFAGPGGTVTDPAQNNAAAGTAYLGQRAGTEAANLQQKGNFANMLINAGQNVGNLSALMAQFTASQLMGQAPGGGMGGLGF